jgi:hypothetical protein
MRYRVIYHVGRELTMKTRVSSGSLTIQDDVISISASSPVTIPFSEIVSVEMFRLHGLGRMIKLACKERTIFLTVVRINLWGYFIVINFFRARELYETIKKRVSGIVSLCSRNVGRA